MPARVTRLWGGLWGNPGDAPLRLEYVVEGDERLLEPWSRLTRRLTGAVNAERRRLGRDEWHGWHLGTLWELGRADGRDVATANVRDAWGREVGTVTLVWPTAEDLEVEA